MKVDNAKLNLILAQRCMNARKLCSLGVAPNTITRLRRGEDVLPATLGRIAKALNVDPAEIIKQED